MKRPNLATACLLLLSLAVATPPARAASEPQRITSATELVTLWSPSQHLYVKGDIGVSDGQLRELETWLMQRPHWTVVLMESAQGERFVDAAGISPTRTSRRCSTRSARGCRIARTSAP